MQRQQINSKKYIHKKDKPARDRQVREQQAKVNTHLPKKNDFIFDTNPSPTLSLFFLLWLVGGYAAAVQQTGNNRQATNDDWIRDICTDSITAYNKPVDLTLGAQNGIIIPAECYNKPECISSNQLTRFYQERRMNKNMEIFLDKRESNLKEYRTWVTDLNEKADRVQSGLKGKTAHEYFSQMMFMISKLKQMLHSENLIQVSKLGNCAEQINTAMKSLLLKKMEFGLKLKIQHIILDANHPDNPNIIKDHRFLVLDGDIPDVIINNNPEAVKKLLDNIKTGYFCDRWNRLYDKADKISDEKRSLYTHQGNWHSATVQTIDLDFANFKYLTLAAKKMICSELTEAGLPAELQPQACQQFETKNSGKKPETKPRMKSGL